MVAMATTRKGNICGGCAGVRELGKAAAMTLDSVRAIFSATMSITGVAVMQWVEEGLIRLDDVAKKYAPQIAEIQGLDGFGSAGKPHTRPTKRDIDVADLVLHTDGFGCEFFSHDDLACGSALAIPAVVSSSFASIRSVLLDEPGVRWNYGCNIDWLGRSVEQQRGKRLGKRLGQVFNERIFGRLAISDISFTLNESMLERRATLHDRARDGRFTPLPA